MLTADITAGAATETVWGWLKGAGDTGENRAGARGSVSPTAKMYS